MSQSRRLSAEPRGRNARRGAPVVIAIAAVALAAAYFCFYGISNDHFDRLTRARQIAMYGDVPFRDFFDPGYFLDLYVSAFLLRLFGDRLLGEVLLNLSFLVAGTLVVFALARRASRSAAYGVFAVLLVVAGQPRSYDFDKILFLPVGLLACWAYIDRPTVKALLALSGLTVLAGLFRYDSAVYLGAAGLTGVLVRHWGDWPTTLRRVALFVVASSMMAAPALVFIQSTAGLGDAFAQIAEYARHEGERTRIFAPITFAFDWRAPHGIVNPDNAVAWLYAAAFAVPIAVAVVPLFATRNRQPAAVARVLSLATMTLLVASFLLRDPIAAHLPDVIPLLVIGGGILANEGAEWLTTDQKPSGDECPAVRAPIRRALVSGGATAVLLPTLASVGSLLYLPPAKNFEFMRRLSTYSTSPIALELLPKSALEPLVEYVRRCTRDQDRVMVAWFAPEINVLAGRGFAAGLPVVFGRHWMSLPYQRRAIELLARQSAPIVVTSLERPLASYEFLWEYVRTHYDLAFEGQLGVSPGLEIWADRRRAIEHRYGPNGLPCYARSDQRP